MRGSNDGVATLPTPVVAALQQALAAEHAAIYGYAAVGPALPHAQAVHAHTNEVAHRISRDALMAILTGAGAFPISSATSYPVPAQPVTATVARRHALGLETTCCQRWRYVVAVAAGIAPAPLEDAVRALTASAVRATRWRAQLTPASPTIAFPGI